MHDRFGATREVAVNLDPAVETERLIQRGRVTALVLAAGLAVAFGSDRSVGITAAVVVLAASVATVQLALRRSRGRRTLVAVGWGSFALDAVVCALALSAVPDDPVDPIVMVTLMIAIEAAVRWGAAGAVGGGLLAGGMAVAWATSGYEAIGRELPATSVAFRMLAPPVIALPAGLLIERLRRQREHTRRLFEHASDPTLIVSDGRVVAANPAAASLLGEPVDRVRGEPFAARFGPLFEMGELPPSRGAPDAARRPVPIPDAQGRDRWYTVLVDAAAGTDLRFVIARDVTEERLREQQLRFHAWHDPLTGLPNRTALESRLTDWLEDQTELGLVFLDLDGFKQVNDLYGHRAGDAVLVEVADRLRRVTRDVDAVHRWAGDEFCLALPDTDPAELEILAERIDEALSQPFEAHGRTVDVGASVGTALARPGDTAATLVHRADEQMYRRKRPWSVLPSSEGPD